MRITKKEVDKITLLFLDHQGRKRALTKEQLFQSYFNEKYDESNAIKLYNTRVKWNFIRRLMKWMRKKSPYFIVNRFTGMGFEYYLVTSEEDGQFFNDRLDSIMNGIRYVQNRYHRYLKDSSVVISNNRKMVKQK